MAFYPYLFFGRNCRQAFTRYQEIFGGDLSLLAMKDLPAGEQAPAGEHADLIMHAALVSADSLLMGSDDPTSDTFGPVQGMQVNWSTKDTGEAKRVYDALAEGGQVIMPIGETFWSPMFGMCVDRFGTPWIVGVESEEAASA